MIVHTPTRGGPRAVYHCELCGDPFSAMVSQRRAGRSRFCTQLCRNRASNISRVVVPPELAELVALLYPRTPTREIAEFIGVPLVNVWKHAHRRGLLKDKDWLRENGRSDPWPTDPAQRKLFSAQVLLKSAITRRSKELKNAR